MGGGLDGRALLRFSVDGTLRRHADLLVQSPHGPNDSVIDGRGNTYVNNVNFDFAAGPPAGDPAPGFVALVKDGCARVVADDLAFPNGMAVTAAQRHAHRGRVVPAPADRVRHRRRRVAVESPGVGRRGRPFTRVREGAEVLDRVQLDRGAFACTLGGNDRSTLFVVAAHWPGAQNLSRHTEWDGTVLAVPAFVPGAGWPGSGSRGS
jgi:sugar lactone lactonase YvrE